MDRASIIKESKVPTIFDTCRLRKDVAQGAITESDFAADLAQVIAGEASKEYSDPALFFANTYPTRGLRELLANVCRRLSGAGGEIASIFRLDTSYGGGKTHGLIALSHAASGMKGVANVAEFLDPDLVPKGVVRVASFDGENADPANGRAMGRGVLARTPWGEIAYLLAGKDGYERVRESDERHVAPGADTLRGLFGGRPTLILLDELSVYLRKVYETSEGRGQLSAFLTSLFKAVEGTQNAALVYTLAIGKEGQASDAYIDENDFIANQMEEAEKVSARKATLLNPTEEDETVKVLRRRLFESIDETQVDPILEAYRQRWVAGGESLSDDAAHSRTIETFRTSYPLHPEVIETLTGKTSTYSNFQRVRGMLRLLARTVAHLWDEKPDDATAIHVHHVDPGLERIQSEIVTRLGQSAYLPAITNDVSAGSVNKPALAESIDGQDHRGMPPYASYVARTIFMHTLAFNDQLKGVSFEQLRYSILCPELDLSFIEDARKKFGAHSAYLDDRPGAPLRFNVEANLHQMIRNEERHVQDEDLRVELNDRIRHIFEGNVFDAVHFPGGAYEVPDEIGDGRPKLAVMSYDGVDVGGTVKKVPKLIESIYTKKGIDDAGVRMYRNHLALVVADESQKEEMRGKMRRRLALRRLIEPERLADLAEHQQEKVRELESKSEHEVAVSIQQCYRHVFYPSRHRVDESGPYLGHTSIDVQSASDKPGAGQKQISRTLHELGKLRREDGPPDSPKYIRDTTPLKNGQITTLALRDEYRRDPGLPILVGDDTFLRGIRQGVEKGQFVYRRGDLLYGPGDPRADIKIDEQATVFTMDYAKNTGIWPRKEKEPKPKPPPPGPKPPKPKPKPEQTSFAAEDVLKAALTQVWEKVRAAKAERIFVLKVRMFETEEAFLLLGVIRTLPGAESTVSITGGYGTPEGAVCEIEFRGPPDDAQPVKEFLDPQLRDAAEKSLQVEFELTFDDGLPVEGSEIESLSAKLIRFVSGSAHVEASTKGKP